MFYTLQIFREEDELQEIREHISETVECDINLLDVSLYHVSEIDDNATIIFFKNGCSVEADIPFYQFRNILKKATHGVFKASN